MFADLLGSQSNRKLPCYLLVWRKRGYAEAVFRVGDRCMSTCHSSRMY